MFTAIKIASRNLFQHKSKTLLLFLFSLFSFLFTVLLISVYESSTNDIIKESRQELTGDLSIYPISKSSVNYDIYGVFCDKLVDFGEQQIFIRDGDRLEEILNEVPEIKSYTKKVSTGAGYFGTDEINFHEFLQNLSFDFQDLPILWVSGVDFTDFFDTIYLSEFEGKIPAPDTNEIIVDNIVRKIYRNLYRHELQIGDELALAGINLNGTVLTGKISGFYTHINSKTALFPMIFTNIDFAVQLAELTEQNESYQIQTDTFSESMSGMNEDELFGLSEDSLFDDMISTDSILISSEPADIHEILQNLPVHERTEQKNFHAYMIRLKNPADEKKVVSYLNKKFASENLPLVAKDAAGSISNILEPVRGIVTVILALLFFIVIVILILIISIHSVSIAERSTEIGTMRAMGSSGNFVFSIFFSESMIINTAAFISGTFMGLLIINFINSLKIKITNTIAMKLFGGGNLHLNSDIRIIASLLFVFYIVTNLLNLLPVRKALRILPAKALAKGNEG